MTDLAAVYQPSPQMVARKLFGEIILVPVSRSVSEVESLYTLDEVGAFVWDALDGARSAADVRDLVLTEYDVASDEAERDLLALLADLQSIGAIVVAAG